MGPDSSVVLTRDCEAVLIPTGEKCLLSAGASVIVAQTLGGSFTVEVGARLARIDGRDADSFVNLGVGQGGMGSKRNEKIHMRAAGGESGVEFPEQ